MRNLQQRALRVVILVLQALQGKSSDRKRAAVASSCPWRQAVVVCQCPRGSSLGRAASSFHSGTGSCSPLAVR